MTRPASVNALREQLKTQARNAPEAQLSCIVCGESLGAKNAVSHFDQEHLATLEEHARVELAPPLAFPGLDDALLIDLLWPVMTVTVLIVALLGAGVLPLMVGIGCIIAVCSVAMILVMVAVFTAGPSVPGRRRVLCGSAFFGINGMVSTLEIDGDRLILRRRFLPDRTVDLAKAQIEVGRARWVVSSAIFSSYNASPGHTQFLGEASRSGGSFIRLSSPTGSVCIGSRSHGPSAFTRRWSSGYTVSQDSRSHIHCRLGKEDFLDFQIRLFGLRKLGSPIDFDRLGDA